MKVLVTGGAGFIGSHIADTYIKAGSRVSVVDNLSSGLRKNLNPKARFYKADILDMATMEIIIGKERPDVVSHHAAMIDVVKSIKDPASTLKTNVLGTGNILIAFGKHKRARGKFIFASSAAVYGDPKKIPVQENAGLAPLSTYGLSKLLAEELIKYYSSYFGFEYLIFRYANVYGPRQGGGVVSVFSSMIKNGKRPTIFGDGTKKRDYIHVSDIARANLLGGRGAKNTILNLGCEKLTTDNQVFEAIAKNLNFKKSQIYKPWRTGEIYEMALASRKAKKILGWTPKVKFEEGIKKTLGAL